MSSISTVKNIDPLRRVATKNTAVALPRTTTTTTTTTTTAIKITGVLASLFAVEAAQGKTRNLQSSMSLSLTGIPLWSVMTDHLLISLILA